MSTKSCCITCQREITVFKCENCCRISCNAIGEQSTKANLDPQQQRHALIQQVDDWECKAIKQIRQTAEEARRLIAEHTTERIRLIEVKLTKLTEQLRQCHRENNFISKDVSQWHDELSQLTEQLVIPAKITVEEVSTPLVTKIVVRIPENTRSVNDAIISIPNIDAQAKWIQNAVTIAGSNGQGNELNQFNGPQGLYIDDDDDDQTIYVADYSNHRVVAWKNDTTSGQVVAGGHGPGNQANQLHYPTAVIVDKQTDSLIICEFGNRRVVRWPRRNGTTGEILIPDIVSYGLTMDSDGYLYVSDYNRHEVKRWKIGETNGIVVAGGNGQGSRLDQLSNPAHIFIDQDRSVYVSDYNNHRVMKWIQGAKEGVVVAGGQGEGNSLTHLCNPLGVVVDQLGTVYVTEYSNNRVTRWPKGTTEGSVVVGGNGRGVQLNQFNGCWSLSFDRQCNLYVADHINHRLQKFSIDQSLIQ